MRANSRALLIWFLVLIVLTGFGFRVYQLGAEALSEDELNKVRAVADYRARGLTSANGEHPLLMKALLAVSLIAGEHWNNSPAGGQSRPELRLSVETSLRLPGAILGALTALLIFLVVTELFGAEIGLIAAALWALDPSAIGFNRIAKEDSFFLFFFLLANVFWLRGQRAAESGRTQPEKYYWLAAAAFGAMMASKYIPHLLAISVSYYYIFLGLKTTRWRVGKRRWLAFFAIMGAVFLLCNPTILLPATWHEMRIFAGEKRIGHDAYEFMGRLYRNQVTLWLNGSPWYFYYVFMGVKLPLVTLAAFVGALPLLFSRRLGDGRYFILFWFFFWFFPFTVLGGKFTRYFTFALPVVLIVAAIGVHHAAGFAARFVNRAAGEGSDAPPRGQQMAGAVRAAVAVVVLAFSALAAVSAAPHYRLYTNALGGGMERAGSYFPHDEFYDSSVGEAAAVVAAKARPAARVASETPELFAHYARRAGRSDLVSISLSDARALRDFEVDDFIVVARGRRYFSNDSLINTVRATAKQVETLFLGPVPSIEIYVLDQFSRPLVSSVAAKETDEGWQPQSTR